MNKIRNAEGQSTVEFALTLVLLFGFILFYFHLALLFGYGNFVQYATFMSARAYLSSGTGDQEEQAGRAREIIVRMLKKSQGAGERFPFVAQGFGGGDPKGFELNAPNFDPSSQDYSWLQGVRYTFRSPIFLLPFGGTGGTDSANTLTLTSESWLGREPTSVECSGGMGTNRWVIDNGC